MDDLMDMILQDESPTNISDKIKDVLYAKAAERIEGIRPTVGASMFGDEQQSESEDQE